MNMLEKLVSKGERFGILICPSEPAVKREFLCWRVVDADGGLRLDAAYLMHYPHPDAPNDATHPVVEFHTVFKASPGDMLYEPLLLFKSAQSTLGLVVSKIPA